MPRTFPPLFPCFQMWENPHALPIHQFFCQKKGHLEGVCWANYKQTRGGCQSNPGQDSLMVPLMLVPHHLLQPDKQTLESELFYVTHWHIKEGEWLQDDLYIRTSTITLADNLELSGWESHHLNWESSPEVSMNIIMTDDWVKYVSWSLPWMSLHCLKLFWYRQSSEPLLCCLSPTSWSWPKVMLKVLEYRLCMT